MVAVIFLQNKDMIMKVLNIYKVFAMISLMVMSAYGQVSISNGTPTTTPLMVRGASYLM